MRKFFVIDSWQGGHLKTSPLVATGPGTYRAVGPIPTGGSWKSIVLLFKRDVVAAAPVWMPEDRQYSLPAIPVEAERVEPMARASTLLTRETHGGPAWPAAIAYTGLGLTVLVWIAALIATSVSINRSIPSDRNAERDVVLHA